MSVPEVLAPRLTTLRPVTPNPLLSGTTIRYELARAERVDLEVFDVRGRRVATLVDGAFLQAGRYQQGWHGKNSDGGRVPPGTYMVRLRVDGAIIKPVHKLSLLR